MKQKTRHSIALLLCAALILSCFAGCATATPTPTEAPAPTEPTKGSNGGINIGIVTRPTEEPEPLPEPIPTEKVTQYPEAFELLIYLNAMTAADAAAYDQKLTGAQANAALAALGLTGSTIAADAASVTGAQFLAQVMKLLGYNITSEADMLSKAIKIHLTRGFWQFDPTAELTVEYAANILRSALNTYTVDATGLTTGVKLAASLNVEHVVLTEYDDPFNRPGSTWVSTTDGKNVTAEYIDIPLVVFGTSTSWCDILVGLGFELDDPANDQHIPKYFRNTMDGGMLSEKFWKHHNGEGGHSECQNDFTGGQDATLEIYEIADYEYRNVCMNTFLGVSDETGFSMYGFERAVYGPYITAERPTYGVYIGHHYWNAYGMGSGYEVVGVATVIKGTLTSGNTTHTVIDGVEYENGQSYSYGKKLTTAPANVGKTYYFLLDRYGFLLGCSETPVE